MNITLQKIELHFGCNVCFISTIRYSKAPHLKIYNTYQILLKLHGATSETYRQYISNISKNISFINILAIYGDQLKIYLLKYMGTGYTRSGSHHCFYSFGFEPVAEIKGRDDLTEEPPRFL